MFLTNRKLQSLRPVVPASNLEATDDLKNLLDFQNKDYVMQNTLYLLGNPEIMTYEETEPNDNNNNSTKTGCSASTKTCASEKLGTARDDSGKIMKTGEEPAPESEGFERATGGVDTSVICSQILFQE